jgi:hypothetical protein
VQGSVAEIQPQYRPACNSRWAHSLCPTLGPSWPILGSFSDLDWFCIRQFEGPENRPRWHRRW